MELGIQIWLPWVWVAGIHGLMIFLPVRAATFDMGTGNAASRGREEWRRNINLGQHARPVH
jgi:hypothetical protein